MCPRPASFSTPKRRLLPVLFAAALALGPIGLLAADAPAKERTAGQASPRQLAGLVYKTIGSQSLALDLYLPATSSPPSPVIVWIHGGGWRAGSRNGVPILPQVSAGFAVASIDYRLSGEAPFPAQIEDAKAAIRWLRAHALEYHLDPARVGVIGHSAGGHLASLIGVTGTSSAFDVGDNLDKSSGVQAVCVMSGPSDMVAMFDGADEHRRSALVALFGGPLEQTHKLAESASLLAYVKSGAPPFLFVHGADDQTVPVQQARAMSGKLEQAGAEPRLIILAGTGHDIFLHSQQWASEVGRFFAEALAKK